VLRYRRTGGRNAVVGLGAAAAPRGDLGGVGRVRRLLFGGGRDGLNTFQRRAGSVIASSPTP